MSVVALAALVSSLTWEQSFLSSQLNQKVQMLSDLSNASMQLSGDGGIFSEMHLAGMTGWLKEAAYNVNNAFTGIYDEFGRPLQMGLAEQYINSATMTEGRMAANRINQENLAEYQQRSDTEVIGMKRMKYLAEFESIKRAAFEAAKADNKKHAQAQFETQGKEVEVEKVAVQTKLQMITARLTSAEGMLSKAIERFAPRMGQS